jgi:predicted nucleotidyltransferase
MSDNTIFIGVCGSMAYGCATEESNSDLDCVGICIPKKADIFTHLKGEIPGFGIQLQRFETWQQHRVSPIDSAEKYDFCVYSIVKFFQLAMENNPNICEVLFLPQHCILHTSQIWQRVQEKKNIFLHKGAFHKFKGYAYSQKSKMKTKTTSSNSKRSKDIESFGVDLKFAYHLVRLLLECEQILAEGTLDLNRNADLLKAIRRGEWSIDKIDQFFDMKEKQLEGLYATSDKVPYTPCEDEIKNLLLECLEMHYGNIDDAIYVPNKYENAINEIQNIISRL